MQIRQQKRDETMWGEGFHQLQPQKQEMMKKLLYLFVFYASKGSRHNYQELSENYFMELMSQAWASTGNELQKRKSTVWSELQLLYHAKGRKTALTFKNFLDLIPSISCYFEPELSIQESVKSFIYHLLKVYETKVLHQLNGRVINTKQKINDQTKEFMMKLVHDLTLIYKLYFPKQLTLKSKNTNLQWSSFDGFLQLMKEFEVFPKLISARDLFYIYHQSLLHQKNQFIKWSEEPKGLVEQVGQTFTLSKFMYSLVTVSKRTYRKLSDVENEEEIEEEEKTKIRSLLEYMETVKSLTKKKTKYEKERFSFIVFDEHSEKEQTKTILTKERIIREPVSKMNFLSLMERIKF